MSMTLCSINFGCLSFFLTVLNYMSYLALLFPKFDDVSYIQFHFNLEHV